MASIPFSDCFADFVTTTLPAGRQRGDADTMVDETDMVEASVALADALVIPTKTSMFARGWPSAASALVCKEKHAPMHPAAE